MSIKDKGIDPGLEMLDQLDQLEALGGGSKKDTHTTSDHSIQAATASSGTESSQQHKTTGKRHGLMWVMGGGILQDKKSLKQVKLVLLLLLFSIAIIANRYHVENLSRERMKTEERISYLKEHKIEMQKSYQETIKISAIAEELDTIGVGLKSGSPRGI